MCPASPALTEDKPRTIPIEDRAGLFLIYRIPEKRVGSEFQRINRHFNHMMDEVRDLKISVYEEKLKAQAIRSSFLAHQIRPHFILNTLNILYSYEPEEFPLIQKMILYLSKYFRYVVNAGSDFVTLGHELEHIRNYFEIQQARFKRTFRAEVSWESEVSGCFVPPLLIQTFAENAIKHAFTPGEIIEILVTARRASPERVCGRGHQLYPPAYSGRYLPFYIMGLPGLIYLLL